MPECYFCKKQIPEDQVYVAWDWDVCRECFQEMEKDVYETYMKRKTDEGPLGPSPAYPWKVDLDGDVVTFYE